MNNISLMSSGERPKSTGPQAHFFNALREGTFLIQRCTACQKCVFYPRLACTHCGVRELSWEEPSGLATVYATTVIRRRDGSDNIVLVDLDEGPRLMSTILGIAPEAVKIGMRVRANVEQYDGAERVVFSPIVGEAR